MHGAFSATSGSGVRLSCRVADHLHALQRRDFEARLEFTESTFAHVTTLLPQVDDLAYVLLF